MLLICALTALCEKATMNGWKNEMMRRNAFIRVWDLKRVSHHSHIPCAAGSGPPENQDHDGIMVVPGALLYSQMRVSSTCSIEKSSSLR
jgi:hypothetical protein